MSFHSWLQNLCSSLAPRRCPRHDKRRGSLRAATHRPNLEVLEDRLTPSFWMAGSFPIDQYPAAATPAPQPPPLADFTSDGVLDAISFDWHYVNGHPALDLAVRPGRGDGTFGDPIAVSTFANQPVLAEADFNGDGRLDLFAAAAEYWTGLDAPPPAYGGAWLGRGDGTFYLESSYTFDAVWFSGDGATHGIAAPTGIGTGDINGDGRVDVVVSGSLDNPWVADTFAVLNNLGDWTPPPPPPAPSISIGDANITEGHAGTAAASFTVTVTVPSTQTITVAYATANGSAQAGSDYQAASGTLTIPAGQTTGTITVLVNGDRLGEPNEAFAVNLSSPTNATIGDSQGVGTIVDDEPRISISDLTKSEGRKGTTTLFTFTVTLSAAYDQPVTMSFQTVNGTAKTSENDYVAKSGTLTFAPGETTKTITIEVKGDSRREANETFYLDLFGLSTNALFTKYRGLGTILNDD